MNRNAKPDPEAHSAALRGLLLVAGAIALTAFGWIALRGTGSEGAASEVTPRPEIVLEPNDASPTAEVVEKLATDEGARVVMGAKEGSHVAAAIDRDVDLHGLVLDSAGAPVGGATVDVWTDQAADEFSFLEPDKQRALIASTTAAADGSFRIPLGPGRLYVLEAHAAGFARARVTHRYAGEYVEIRLSSPGAIRGVVYRVADDLPVADAEVQLRPTYGKGRARNGTFLSVRTSSTGVYEMRDIAAGSYTLRAVPREQAASDRLDVELAPGQSQQLDIGVGPGLEISGRVVDALTKLPLEAALVSEGWSFRRTVRTDAQGEFIFRGLSDGQNVLHARAPGHGETEIRFRSEEGELLMADVEFELLPAHRARGRIVDPGGNPVAGAYVAAIGSEYRPPHGDQHSDWRSFVTGADGLFEITDLRPDIAHTLLVRREGSGTVVYEFPGGEQETPDIELGDIVLSPALLLRGIVVDSEGTPFVDLEVTMVGANSDRGRYPKSREAQWVLDTYVAERETRTDDLGRFGFADLAPGTYRVSVRQLGSEREQLVFGAPQRAARNAEVTLESGQSPELVRLVIDRGLRISGWVTTLDGGPLPTVLVRVKADVGELSVFGSSLADGSFEVEGLTPGIYSLTADPDLSEEELAAGRQLASLRLRNLEAGARDVQVRLERPVALVGFVLDRAGNPVDNASVLALHEDGVFRGKARTDAAGRFEIGLAAGDSVNLLARPPTPDGGVVSDPAAHGHAKAVLAGAQVTIRLAWTP